MHTDASLYDSKTDTPCKTIADLITEKMGEKIKSRYVRSVRSGYTRINLIITSSLKHHCVQSLIAVDTPRSPHCSLGHEQAKESVLLKAYLSVPDDDVDASAFLSKGK